MVTYHLDRKMSHFIRDHSDPDFFPIWATKSILQTQTEYAEYADTYTSVKACATAASSPLFPPSL